MTTNLERLIRPRSVAVIGASGDPGKTSGRPVAYLLKHRFPGKVFPVNPKLSQIDDLPCYPDVASLPEVPDVGIVLLGADSAHRAVHDLAQRGAGAAIVLASGYTETGERGAARQAELLEAAGQMRLLGPNTIGLVNLTESIVLSATGALEMDSFPVGPIGVVSQSGGILGSLLSRAADRGIGLSKLISTSNEADLELADFVDYLAQDPDTRVIALYIEAVRNPARFRAAVAKASATGKPVIAFKIGRSEAGALAAVSHTGAMAGSDRAYDALFMQLGVIRAQTLSDLLDIPAALATGRMLRGRRVVILTSTGGAGALLSDSLGVAGFDTPAPDKPTAAALRALETGTHSRLDRNPIDLTLAGLQPDLLRGAIRTLLSSKSYDALAIVVGSSSLAMPSLLADALGDCLTLSDKPVIAYLSPHAPQVGALLTRSGVPAYPAAESCACALAGMLQAERNRHRSPAPATVTAQVALGELPSGSLDEAQARTLFERFGLRFPSSVEVSSAAQACKAARAMRGPVALKILSSSILHKSDVGGVAINLEPRQLSEAMAAMAVSVAAATGETPRRFLVQQMVRGGEELLLGIRRDPLGMVMLLGFGGITAELFGDSTIRLLPEHGGLSLEQAHEMMRELKGWPLLNGFRGRPLADQSALARAMVAFSAMAAQLGDRLIEAEINPLFVLPLGQGVLAADAVAVLSDPQQAQLPRAPDDRVAARHCKAASQALNHE